MAFEIITQEEQILFLNSTWIRGVQNVDFQYEVNAGPARSLGKTEALFDVNGPQIGTVNISSLIIGQDQFISFTGDTSVNGYLLRTKDNSSENYSFMTGYLTSYRSSCNVGDLPKIDATFQIFGNIGKISPSESSNFTAIAASSIGDLNPTTFENFNLSLNNFNTSRVISYNIDINVNRRPDFILGSKTPKRIAINYPIEVTATFTISAGEYNAYNIRLFPSLKRSTNVSLSFQNSAGSNVVSYSFSNMTLISESYNAQVDQKSTVTLIYKGYVHQDKSFTGENLIIYLNSAHSGCFISSSKLNDLSLSRNNFTATHLATTITDGIFDFDNLNQTYLQTNSNVPFTVPFTLYFRHIPTITDSTIDPQAQPIFSWAGLENKRLSFYFTSPESFVFFIGLDELDHFGTVPVSTGSILGIAVVFYDSYASIYINGVFLEQIVFAENISSTSGPVFIGRDILFTDPFLNGAMYNFLIWNKALSDSQISQVHTYFS